jgi:siroheme synthase-like protein
MPDLLPLFLNLRGRPVLLVGGGAVATGKLKQLLAVEAHVRVVAPDVTPEVASLVEHASSAGHGSRLSLARRPVESSDFDDVWLVVAAAPPEVNRAVATIAESRRIFVNAVDDPANASAFLGGVVRRDGVTVAISTSGSAPALASLLREAIDAVMPDDLATWVWRARAERVVWRREAVPMEQRKPLLLKALNALYRSPEAPDADSDSGRQGPRRLAAPVAQGFSPAVATVDVAQGFGPAMARDREHGSGPAVPWLNAPEDSWL